MRWLFGVAVAAVGCATAVASGGSGGWSSARPVAGPTMTANISEYTAPDYVGTSCSSTADCTVAYQESGKSADVVGLTRRNGQWGAARVVPGLRGYGAEIWVACVSAGRCVLAATGDAGRGGQQVMVARLANGVWSKAEVVPGLAALRPGQWSNVSSLSCSAAGWCALAGETAKPGDEGHGQPFVATEHDGSWNKAQAVPGLAALTGTWTAGITAVSCDGAGTCTAAGYYRDRTAHNFEPFAVTERAGRWGQVQPISGSGTLGASYVTALSCSKPGDCTAAGTEGNDDTGTPVGMFTVTESGGTWHEAAALRGTIRLQYPVDTENVTALTCTAPGQCVALGVFATNANSEDSVPVQATPFEAVQKNGTWSEVHALRGLPANAVAWVSTVSCASAGDCSAGGYWLTNSGSEDNLSNDHAFVASEKDGVWTAEGVPGLATLHSKDSAIHEVLCQTSHGCAAIGDYWVKTRRLFTTSHG
jgi:hypothetical protein